MMVIGVNIEVFNGNILFNQFFNIKDVSWFIIMVN